MEWFHIGPNRESHGPYTLEKMVELFRAGAINGETLIWMKDIADWTPAKSCQEFFTALRTMDKRPDIGTPPLPPGPPQKLEIDPKRRLHVPEIAPTPPPPKLEIDPEHRLLDPEIVVDGNPLHPSRRYFARLLDVSLVAVLVGFLAELYLPESPGFNKLMGSRALFGMVILLVFVPIESILLTVFGTTFGKALYSIEVKRKNLDPISFSTAISRSFGVYLRGLGLGFPLISLFTLYFGYKALTEKGTTSWDADNELEVSHHPIGYAKIAAIGLVWCLYIGAVVWGTVLEVNDRYAAEENPSPVKRESSVTQETPAKRESPPPNAEKVEPVFIEEENRLRPTLPIKINDRLTLVGVRHAGNTMEYNLEIEFAPAADRTTFLDALKRLVTESTCAKPKFREAMKAGANFAYLYFEKTPRSPDVAKTRVAAIKVTAADCPQ